MNSNSLKILISSVLVFAQLFAATPVYANYESFDLAEKRLVKAEEYLEQVNDKIARTKKLTPDTRIQLEKQWLKNWRAYDRKRASQGTEVDLLNQRLRELRGKIGSLTIQLALSKHHKRSAEDALNSVNYGDGLAPGDKLDVTKEVREAKRTALEYRLSVAENNMRAAQDALDVDLNNYAELLSSVAQKVDKLSVFHPRLEDVKKAQERLSLLFETTDLGKTEYVLSGEDAIARELINEASYNFLVELLENRPVQLEKFQVTFDGNDWFHAALVDGDRVSVAKGNISPDVRIRAYKNVEKNLTNDIENLKLRIDEATQLVNSLGKLWREQANVVFDKQADVEQTKVDLRWVNLGVEMSFATMSILATGGLAGAEYAPNLVQVIGQSFAKKSVKTFGPYVDPIMKNSGAAIAKLAKGVSKKTSELTTYALEATAQALTNIHVKSSSKLIGDYYKEQQKQFIIGTMKTIATQGLNVLPSKKAIEKLGNEEYYLANQIELSGAQGIIIGDVIESVVTNAGLDDFRSTASLGKAVVTNNLDALSPDTVSKAGSAGIAIASTAIKAVNQKIVDTLTSRWEREALVAGAKAGVYRTEYRKILNVRNAMQDELVSKERLKTSMTELIEKGPQSKQYNKIADTIRTREEFDQFGRHKIHLSFSRPISKPPVVEAENIVFDAPRPLDFESGLGSINWVVQINSETLPVDATGIDIKISLDPLEPYKLFDSNPENPAQLVMIDKNGWKDYGPGFVTHTLRIDPRAEVIVGMNDIEFIGHWFSCDNPKPVKVSSIRGRFDIGPELKYQDVEDGSFLQPFAPDEVIQVCVDANDEPKRDKENRIIATSDAGATIYSNGYSSRWYDVYDDEDLLPSLPGEAEVQYEDLIELIPRYNAEGEMIGLDSKVSGKVIKLPKLEDLGSENENISLEENISSNNAINLDSDSSVPNFENLDSIIPDVSTDENLPDLSSNAPRIDAPVLYDPFDDGEGLLALPELDGEDFLLPDLDSGKTLSLGIDENFSRTLSAPIPIISSTGKIDLGELEGTPLGELIAKLGNQSPIIIHLTKDGIQDGDQLAAKAILDTMK